MKLTVKQTAEKFGVTETTIRDYADAGKIPFELNGDPNSKKKHRVFDSKVMNQMKKDGFKIKGGWKKRSNNKISVTTSFNSNSDSNPRLGFVSMITELSKAVASLERKVDNLIKMWQ